MILLKRIVPQRALRTASRFQPLNWFHHHALVACIIDTIVKNGVEITLLKESL
jgi:hypothetical protein